MKYMQQHGGSMPWKEPRQRHRLSKRAPKVIVHERRHLNTSGLGHPADLLLESKILGRRDTAWLTA
jgi:hypothetical protein